MNNEVIFIITDGSSITADNKTGFDAAAAYLIMDSSFNVLHKESILLKDHTNNYAEMYAIYKGTKYVVENLLDKYEIWTKVVIITDSQLCEKSLNEWMDGWLRKTNNEVLFSTAGKVKNQELIKSAYINILTIKLKLVTYICHINSHKSESEVPKMYGKFMNKYPQLDMLLEEFNNIYKANQIVDKMAYNELNSIK